MFTCMSFGNLATISLFGSFIHTTQYQACFRLLYTLNANKNLIVLFCIHDLVICISGLTISNYQQFTLYWVDTLSYAVFIKVLCNLIARYLLYLL